MVSCIHKQFVLPSNNILRRSTKHVVHYWSKINAWYLTGAMHTWTRSTLIHFNFTVGAIVSWQTLTEVTIYLIL